MSALLANLASVVTSASPAIDQSGAQHVWEEGSPRWLYALDDWGPWLLGAIALVLLVRAMLQDGRYRAMKVLDEPAREAVRQAIVAAESKTVGEIVPVVLERSDRHPEADWLSALVILLLGSALLEGKLPWHAPHWLLLCQIGLGALGFALARLLPAWKRMFVSERRATDMALEQARQEFFAQGLHGTQACTGVLLFVSLLERRVIVLGDAGIDAKVGEEHWRKTKDAVLEGIRRGHLRDGLIEGVRTCGAELETHFPWASGDRNEIPDRLVVRPE